MRAEIEREVVYELLDVLGPKPSSRLPSHAPAAPHPSRRADLARASLVYWIWMLVVGAIGLVTKRGEIAELVNVIAG